MLGGEGGSVCREPALLSYRYDVWDARGAIEAGHRRMRKALEQNPSLTSPDDLGDLAQLQGLLPAIVTSS